MHTPAQLRDKRITQLYTEFKGKNITTIEPIYQKALELFPRTLKKTSMSYAEATLRMLKTKKK